MKNIINFIKKAHKGTKRKDGSPCWPHLARVAKILEFVLIESKEANNKEKEIIITSAYLHDIIEDTKYSRKEIEKLFGKYIADNVWNLSKDKDLNSYTNKMKDAPESSRLIKMADMIDNLTESIYKIKKNGYKWTIHFSKVIIFDMKNMLLDSKFKEYKKTSEILKAKILFSDYLLTEMLKLEK